MMNIQFMSKENAVTVKDSWTGNDTVVYVPDFEALVKDASCDEEIAAIREIENRITSGKSCFKGFTFQIVYMSHEKALVYNKETRKQEWVMKWQMMQHPWHESIYGVKDTKEQMIAKIEAMYN